MTNRTKNNIGNFQRWIILFVWVLIFALPLLFSNNEQTIKWEHIFKIWTEYLFVFIIFLVNRFVLVPQLFLKNKRNLYFSALIGAFLILVISAFVFGQFEIMSHIRNLPPPPPEAMEMHRPPQNAIEKEFIPPYANLLILGILLIGFDTGLIISVKWIHLEQNKLQLEKENIETKMEFLQNQISPHFFMNTLNNIHALVDINSEDAKEAIIKLSRMMGYVLYESKTENIPVEKEMNFVRSFVELMRIRFTDDVQIELNIPEILPSVTIPSLLTISYIENAFKHGISYEETSFVKINFKFTENKMIFEIQNSIQNKTVKTNNSGLGIENTRNRLNLIYGTNYDLIIEQLPEKIFKVKLTIPT